MLVATRDIKCFGKPVLAGQPIPTPEKWDPIVLQSNINIGWVKDVPEGQVKRLVPEPHLPKKKKPEPKQEVLRCCGRDFKSKRALSVHSRSHR